MPNHQPEDSQLHDSQYQPTVSILAEIPEDFHESLTGYLEIHPDWDCNRVFCAALSLFLIQNNNSDTPDASRNYRRTARVYLDSLFNRPA